MSTKFHPPTIAEQIDVIERTIGDLHDSFATTDEDAGDERGHVTDPETIRDIECLRATRLLLIHSQRAGIPWRQTSPAGEQRKHNKPGQTPNE